MLVVPYIMKCFLIVDPVVGACVVMPPWLIFYSFMGFFPALTLPGIIVVVLRVHACASLLATPLGMP